MTDLHRVVADCIMDRIESLQWQCKGCWRMDGCEKDSGNYMLYCKELIVAALTGEITFKYKDAPLNTMEDSAHLTTAT